MAEYSTCKLATDQLEESGHGARGGELPLLLFVFIVPVVAGGCVVLPCMPSPTHDSSVALIDISLWK